MSLLVIAHCSHSPFLFEYCFGYYSYYNFRCSILQSCVSGTIPSLNLVVVKIVNDRNGMLRRIWRCTGLGVHCCSFVHRKENFSENAVVLFEQKD